jgi:hypothetical protein
MFDVADVHAARPGEPRSDPVEQQIVVVNLHPDIVTLLFGASPSGDRIATLVGDVQRLPDVALGLLVESGELLHLRDVEVHQRGCDGCDMIPNEQNMLV